MLHHHWVTWYPGHPQRMSLYPRCDTRGHLSVWVGRPHATRFPSTSHIAQLLVQRGSVILSLLNKICGVGAVPGTRGTSGPCSDQPGRAAQPMCISGVNILRTTRHQPFGGSDITRSLKQRPLNASGLRLPWQSTTTPRNPEGRPVHAAQGPDPPVPATVSLAPALGKHWL